MHPSARRFLVKEEVRKTPQSHRRAGIGSMIVGAVFLGLGVIATIVSYSMASGGGTYFVFYGAMIFGALDLLVGLVRYLSAPKGEVMESSASRTAGSQVYSPGGVLPAASGPERPSVIDPALSPSLSDVYPAAASAAGPPPGSGSQDLAPLFTAPTDIVPSQMDVPATPSAAFGQPQAAAQPSWTVSPAADEGGGQVYCDEAAVTRLREQTRTYYAQRSMRAQGRCEICGRGLSRTARWRGAVRCVEHL